ncbi:hypothetical protein JD844_029095 [Phrynosoma platyrhinos]|uniref:Uncharacterized protein n=1 Tax=Phrynosoma platyrhinos TaxID=52577 RepID=A0ABQ7SIP5_PHRPL|nr:hypothetical protein JD844_029095 [Phrynosoma platyrhinos]
MSPSSFWEAETFPQLLPVAPSQRTSAWGENNEFLQICTSDILLTGCVCCIIQVILTPAIAQKTSLITIGLVDWELWDDVICAKRIVMSRADIYYW